MLPNDAEIDGDTFERFVARSQSMVCAVAYSAIGDRALSEEVAQEAFLIAWRALPTLREPQMLPAWLCGIVRRVAANVRRKRRWEVTTMAIPEHTPSTAANPLDELLTREEEELAARALGGLAEKYREPLVLFYRGEQSVREVAAALALSEDAVKQRLSRGRKLLKQSAERVERVLRATRPGAAFTAATVAAFLAAKASAAGAASAGVSVTPASAVGTSKMVAVLAIALGGLVAVGAAASRATGSKVTPASAVTVAAPTRAPVTAGARVGSAGGSPGDARTQPSGRAFAGPSSPPTPSADGWRAGLQRRVNLDFGQAGSYDILGLLAEVSDVPILVDGDIAAKVNLRLHDVTVIDALDEVVAQAGATRTEVPCLRIIARSASSVPLSGGALITASFDAVELRRIVRAIEGPLGTRIVVADDVAPVKLTIRFDSTPASVALTQLLREADVGVESATAFEITPTVP